METKTFLVVDDSATMRQLIGLTLRKVKEATVLEASDGAEAAKRLASDRVDLVVTDIKMPQMDGLQLVSHIRQELKLTELPVIILTTKGEEGDREAGLKAGANAYLTKPLSGAALLQLIDSLLSSKSAVKG
ncbi:MAG: response regulator [Candidatus Methylomirabilales bacterium]